MSTPNPRGHPFTVRQAADYLGLPTKALYRLCALHRISHYRSDGQLLERRAAGGLTARVKSGRIWFYQSDLDAWLEGQRVSCCEEATPTRTPAPSISAEPWGVQVPGVRRFA
jgi:excisionase family DNA binding protein